jgi:hypothetical protein
MNGGRFISDVNMGRGCSCCTKKGTNCCPEDVFSDDNTELLLRYSFTADKTEQVQITVDTENAAGNILATLSAEKGVTYVIYATIAKSKSGIISSDDIVEGGGIYAFGGFGGSSIAGCNFKNFLFQCDNPSFVNYGAGQVYKSLWKYYQHDLNSLFNSGVKNHNLVLKKNNSTIIPYVLYCIKKYTGDLKKLYGGLDTGLLCIGATGVTGAAENQLDRPTRLWIHQARVKT